MRKEEIVEISAFLAPKSAPNGKEKTKMLEEIVSSVYLNRKALKDGILSCYVTNTVKSCGKNSSLILYLTAHFGYGNALIAAVTTLHIYRISIAITAVVSDGLTNVFPADSLTVKGFI